MRREELLTLLAYNRWANQRVLECSARLPPERLAVRAPVSHGSLVGSLVHVLAAEVVWRTRCEDGISPPTLLTPEEFPTLAALRERWDLEMERMARFAEGLDESSLNTKVRYTNT